MTTYAQREREREVKITVSRNGKQKINFEFKTVSNFNGLA